jgi:histone acetyltransferase (RNA polymerase elongator complex component)
MPETELAKIEKPTPYRKFTVEEMIDALEHSRGLIAPAARYLGCKRDTVRSYIEQYPEVAKAKADMREAVTDTAESSLYRAIEDREAWAVCFYLKTQAKGRGYVERAELSGTNSAPVKIRLVYDE